MDRRAGSHRSVEERRPTGGSRVPGEIKVVGRSESLRSRVPGWKLYFRLLSGDVEVTKWLFRI